VLLYDSDEVAGISYATGLDYLRATVVEDDVLPDTIVRVGAGRAPDWLVACVERDFLLHGEVLHKLRVCGISRHNYIIPRNNSNVYRILKRLYP